MQIKIEADLNAGQDLWFKHPTLQNYNTSKKLMLCVEFSNPLALQ